MTGLPAAVLVAAVGNALRADDGAGPKVAELIGPRLPPGARLVVYGDNVMGLVDDCVDCDALVCVDALAPAVGPGRIGRFDVSCVDLPRGLPPPSSHGCGLAEAIALARALGRLPKTVIVHGVEAAKFEIGAAMTPSVATALTGLAEAVLSEALRLTQRA
jgi:hydrogenase maturation protease